VLAKYSIRAPVDGVVRSIQAAPGSYVSPLGAFDSYTQGMGPLIIMGTAGGTLQVRVYIDEILIQRLAEPAKLRAEMFIRGTDVHVPLTFSRIQPLVSPKIELSNARQERVDLRVLPIIFRFRNAGNVHLYPGQLVDVYVDGK
jgi:HlyD family secretion protein